MILVDEPRWRARGTTFAHLASDESYHELHAFVAALAVPRPLRFHGDHYDVPAVSWRAVVDGGATVVRAHELVSRLRDAGLRRAR